MSGHSRTWLHQAQELPGSGVTTTTPPGGQFNIRSVNTFNDGYARVPRLSRKYYFGNWIGKRWSPSHMSGHSRTWLHQAQELPGSGVTTTTPPGGQFNIRSVNTFNDGHARVPKLSRKYYFGNWIGKRWSPSYKSGHSCTWLHQAQE